MIPAERVAVIVQANKSGATLPQTTAKALEMLVSLGPAESTKRAAQPIMAEDLTRSAGTFQNGAETIEIVARGNQLYMRCV